MLLMLQEQMHFESQMDTLKDIDHNNDRSKTVRRLIDIILNSFLCVIKSLGECCGYHKKYYNYQWESDISASKLFRKIDNYPLNNNLPWSNHKVSFSVMFQPPIRERTTSLKQSAKAIELY
jgi:hypothetical protein